MSTEFAISRFLVPAIAQMGWAVFMDCDVLVRTNVARLFPDLDERYAVYCVKHRHQPAQGVKMDGQVQAQYGRKNWSSMMVFNCNHPANIALDLDMVNSLPGRDLHRFCWLKDEEIGELPPEWNYLVGETHLPEGVQPKIVHHTNGSPCMPGYEDTEYAYEWREELARWAA